MGDEQHRELRREIHVLSSRLDELERTLRRVAAIAATAALAASLVLPFWTYTDDGEQESFWLFGLPKNLADTGGGPYRQEAWLAGAAVGLLILAILLAGAAVLHLAFAEPRPDLSWWHRLSIWLCGLGTAGIWSLTFILVSRATDQDVELPVGPGMIALTVGAVLSVLSLRISRLDR